MSFLLKVRIALTTSAPQLPQQHCDMTPTVCIGPTMQTIRRQPWNAYLHAIIM